MRTWHLAQLHTQCGGCGEFIAPGDPMQRIEFDGPRARVKDRNWRPTSENDRTGLTFSGTRRPLIRCRTCADEPVPREIVPPAKQQRLEVMNRLGLLPLDRDPGEDG